MLIAACLFWMFNVGNELNEYAGEELLANNELVVAATDAELFTGLPVVEGQNSNYDKLQQHYMKLVGVMQKEYGIRNIYAMKVVDGEIKFIVDSSMPTDPSRHEPGTIYERPPQALLDTIRYGTPQLYGPYTDEFGSFYSAFASQYDKSGQIVAFIATDIEINAFKKLYSNDLDEVRTISIILLGLYPLIFFVIERLLSARRLRRTGELNELHRAEEREKLLMNIGEGVVAFNESGKILFANKFAVDSVCRNEAECLGQDYRIHWMIVDQKGVALPEEHQPLAVFGPGVLSEHKSSSHAGHDHPYLKRPDGAVFPVEISIVKTDLETGELVALMVFRDITERVKFEDALVESEKKYRVLFENSEDAMMLLTPEKFVDCNNATLKIFGYKTREEFLGKHPGDVSPPHQADGRESHIAANEKIATALKEGHNFFNWIHQRADGTDFFANVLLTPMRHEGMDVLQATVRDITQEVKIDQMKTDFINIAVHQLKTPLTALKWAVEMLSEASSARKPEETQAINDIADVTRGLTELVKSLLNITRIESGRLTIDPKPTDLAALAVGVIRENTAAAAKKKQHIAFTSEDGLPVISVDPLLIREVYKNLLTNAIKYSPLGAQIEVRLEKKGEELISLIKDNGYGIPLSDQKRIYDKFFRASNIVGKSEEGTGLGLYFAKQIVEVSGGRIWLESTEDVGTTFYFSLPLVGSKARSGMVRLS